MKPVTGYHLIGPDDLQWRPSNLMRIPNADFLERTGSENLGARLWRLPPGSANTLHRHIRQEEFYFVLEGTGRMRVSGETLTVPKHGGVLVGPEQLRQVFNDTDTETLWLIVGAPEEASFIWRRTSFLPSGVKRLHDSKNVKLFLSSTWSFPYNTRNTSISSLVSITSVPLRF